MEEVPRGYLSLQVREGLPEEGIFEERPKRVAELDGTVGEKQGTCKGPEIEINCIFNRASVALGE